MRGLRIPKSAVSRTPLSIIAKEDPDQLAIDEVKRTSRRNQEPPAQIYRIQKGSRVYVLNLGTGG
jgi:hypothetical protein